MLGIRKIFSNRVLLQKLKSNKRFMGSAGHHDDHHDDHGHHEHMMPPFARLPPPDKAMVCL